MIYNPSTKELYADNIQASQATKYLGINEENCTAVGCVAVTEEPRPPAVRGKKVVRDELPTINEDNSWSLKWNYFDLTEEELVEERRLLTQQIKDERDRRLQADFEFQGKMFQRDDKSLKRITGAASLAGFYLGAGGDPTSLKWHATPDNPNPNDFGWIASDNTVVPMDAATVFAFGQAAANVESRLVFKYAALRNMDPLPEDYEDDKWW